MKRTRFLTLVLLMSAAVLPLSAAETPDMAPVKKWIARQSKVTSLIADFKQERHLRTVKKPLESTGRLWFAGDGAFRWQAGDPPKLIAILSRDEELSILRPDKKEAEVFSREALEREDAAQGLSFLKAGFPKSMEAFEKKFEVTRITQNGEYSIVDVKPVGGEGAFVVRKIVLYLHSSGVLGSMELHFRDGSWISNTFTGLQENAQIADSQFQADLSGYTVKKK